MTRVPETNRYTVANWRTFWKDLKLRARGGAKLAHGLKRQYVPGLEGFVYTPYYANLIRKRRAARKVAHESRRRNRNR